MNHKVSYSPKPSSRSVSGVTNYGRVLKVYLEKTERRNNLGNSITVYPGTIVLKPLNASSTVTVEDILNTVLANPLTSNIKNIPLVHEIVPLFVGPSKLSSESSTFENVYYYGIPLSLSNRVEHNSTHTIESETFVESGKVPSRNFIEGDVLVEGRHGHSIRFTDTGNLEKQPAILISNGYKLQKGSYLHSQKESFTLDDTSIYITSTYTSRNNVFEYNKLRNTSKVPKNTPSICVRTGDIQVYSTVGNIKLNTKQGIELGSEYMLVETSKNIQFESKEIHLGYNTASNPVVKYKELEQVLSTLCTSISTFSGILKQLPTAPPAAIGIIIGSAVKLSIDINRVKTKISNIKSDKVFVA